MAVSLIITEIELLTENFKINLYEFGFKNVA